MEVAAEYGQESEEAVGPRPQDRARVAGGQDYEVRHEAKKTRRSVSAVKKMGGSRKNVERRLDR
ncbi:DUF3606 domain-containing protein [Bradyrhizobium sp. C-145]|uniref:DUF3606 domain-containing protein n=1 Tax=Bradyrhizobium sp. C-145 TaxID=574727 RepID=UPI00201B81D2|nr:DUF3606 domain-containing protein [Bradyrhizobium sp. C-145]UQR60765.1 DUF3606 domain-containing protein [Bradyrhizobium sp. C-145]